MRKLVLLLTIALLQLGAQTAPGTYTGTWSGGASGDFRLVLTEADKGDWKAEVVFTLGTDEVKTKVTSVKVDGNKITVIYQYDLQGTQLQSNVTGEFKGKVIEGTYKATSVGDGAAVDEGTWKVSAK